MAMTGIYRIALLPTADEAKFVDHMVNEVFDTVQLTRVTSGFSHTLLKAQGDLRQYAWVADVELVGDGRYDFGQNMERVQKAIEQFGLLIGVDTYINLADKK